MNNDFTKEEEKLFETLSTPRKLQDYLDTIPFNHEESGETCSSAKDVMRRGTAHCLEGAFLATTIRSHHGHRPLIVSLKVTEDDYDHIIIPYKENNHWGALSKTNHAVLGFRDPVYRTIRELVMSYFHEYFLIRDGKKTLRGYSKLINLNRFGTSWKTSQNNCFDIAVAISDAHHISIIPKGSEKLLRNATILERASASISQDGK